MLCDYFACAIIRQLHLCQYNGSLPEAQELSEEGSWISTDITSKHSNLLASSKRYVISYIVQWKEGGTVAFQDCTLQSVMQ